MPSSTFVVSITPFDHRGNLDEPELRRHLARLADAGIGVYVGGGGTGEGHALSGTESRRVLEVSAEELAGTVPVRAMGVEPRSAEQMVAYSRAAAVAGLDATQVYPLDIGHGAVPSPEELRAYYDQVLGEAEGPLVISTHMAAGYLVPLALLDELLGNEQVIGVNCTTADWTYLVRSAALARDRAELHVGGPMQALSALALGATGYLSSEANLAPRLCVAVVERWDAGDLAGAGRAYHLLMEMFTRNMAFQSAAGVKAALAHLGWPGGRPRPPRLPVAPTAAEAFVGELLDLGALDQDGGQAAGTGGKLG